MKLLLVVLAAAFGVTSLAQAQAAPNAQNLRCFHSGDCLALAGSAHGQSECVKYEELASGEIIGQTDGTFIAISATGSVVSNLVASSGTNQDGLPTTTYSIGNTPLLSFERYPSDLRIYRNSRFYGTNEIGGLYFGQCEPK